MELKIFAFIGIVATAVVAATAIVGLCIWIERRLEKAAEHERWKNRVSDDLIYLKSSCNYLESQSRKSQKPKPGAKKR